MIFQLKNMQNETILVTIKKNTYFNSRKKWVNLEDFMKLSDFFWQSDTVWATAKKCTLSQVFKPFLGGIGMSKKSHFS